MKKSKNIIFLLVCIIAVIVLVKYLSDPYRRIRSYVEKNCGNLTASCEYYLSGEPIDSEYDGIKIDGIYGEDYQIVQFSFTAYGISPVKYCGFYYSPEDIPVTHCNENFVLQETGTNEWEWTGYGDNGGKINKMQDCWYYYEAWF